MHSDSPAAVLFFGTLRESRSHDTGAVLISIGFSKLLLTPSSIHPLTS